MFCLQDDDDEDFYYFSSASIVCTIYEKLLNVKLLNILLCLLTPFYVLLILALFAIDFIKVILFISENIILFFNDYTFSVIGIYWCSFLKSTKGTFNIMMNHKITILCNDSIIKFVLMVSEIILIAIAMYLGSIYSKGSKFH